MSDIRIEYCAVQNRNELANGWLPGVWDNGKPICDDWGARSYDQDEALLIAKGVAERTAERYTGDWNITVVERVEEPNGS